jgi:hypothetical protein
MTPSHTYPSPKVSRFLDAEHQHDDFERAFCWQQRCGKEERDRGDSYQLFERLCHRVLAPHTFCDRAREQLLLEGITYNRAAPT